MIAQKYHLNDNELLLINDELHIMNASKTIFCLYFAYFIWYKK